MEEEQRLRENKRILTELENKLNSYLSTGSVLAPPSHNVGASAEKVSKDFSGIPTRSKGTVQPSPSNLHHQYVEDCSNWPKMDLEQFGSTAHFSNLQPQGGSLADPARRASRELVSFGLPTKKSLEQFRYAPTCSSHHMPTGHLHERSRQAPSVEAGHVFKLNTTAKYPIVEQCSHEAKFKPSLPNRLQVRPGLLDVDRKPDAALKYGFASQVTPTRAVLRPPPPKQQETDSQKVTGNKISPIDDYNKRKAELDELVKRFEQRKQSEIFQDRSISRGKVESYSREPSKTSTPVPRINIGERNLDKSQAVREREGISNLSELRRAGQREPSLGDRSSDLSKSSMRTIQVKPDLNTTVRDIPARVPIHRERSQTIERYLRRKSVYSPLGQNDSRANLNTQLEASKTASGLETTARTIYLQDKTSAHNNKNHQEEHTTKQALNESLDFKDLSPRRLRSAAQDREYKEIFKINPQSKESENKENDPHRSRQLALTHGSGSAARADRKLVRTFSTCNNSTMVGIEGLESSTFTKQSFDERSMHKTASSSQLLTDERFLESLANLLVDKIGLKIQQQANIPRTSPGNNTNTNEPYVRRVIRDHPHPSEYRSAKYLS